MPEHVPSFTAIALAAMMSYENDIVSRKSLGTDDSQVWYGNGPSALGASLTKERIERFHSAREGRTHGLQSDKHRPNKLHSIHLAMEEMEQLIFDTDTICRVTRYDLDDQQRPGQLYRGSLLEEVPFLLGGKETLWICLYMHSILLWSCMSHGFESCRESKTTGTGG
jgi:hypothetical protein